MHLARIEAEGTTQSRPSRRPVRSVAQAFRFASGFALAAAMLTSAIGCGNNYRPVVSAINPVGPAAQPAKFAVVISDPEVGGNSLPGLITFVDFSGDTVLITANVGVNPNYLILNGGSASAPNANTGYTLNSDHTLSSFDIDTSLLTSQINQTTLLPGSNPISLFPEGVNTYLTDPGQTPGLTGVIGQFTGTSPLSLQQNLPVPAGYTPIYTVGIASTPRAYALLQNVSGGNGLAATIETATNTIDPNPLPTGKNPVYGVMTPDAKRAFIMDQGDGTITVVNVQTNQLDTVPSSVTNPAASNPISLCPPAGALSNANPAVCANPASVNPVWADFAPVRSEMLVANAGDGVNPGFVSIVSIPLCSATALPNNPNCNLANPVDAIGFGSIIANVPVGVNPVQVGVLQDTTNSRAYVVNSGNPNLPCAGNAPSSVTGATTTCSVSVIDLNANVVIATIPLENNQQLGTGGPTQIPNGHPDYIAVTSGTPTGKVYITSPEQNIMTVIRTDTNAIDTTVPLQGAGIAVRVTAP